MRRWQYVCSVVATLLLFTVAVTGRGQQPAQPASAQAPAAQAAPAPIPGIPLGPEAAPAPKIPEGFTPIFNGKDLTGWHISSTNHHGTTPDYHVMHGLIVGTQNPLGKGGILLTDKKYKNVEVYMEVKPDWGCDSGLFFRSNEAGDAYQVTLDYLVGGCMGCMYGEGLEGVGGRGGNRGATRGAGAGAAAGAQPVRGRINQVDMPWSKVWKREQWNSVRARIEGDIPHITAWINDQQVLDFTDTANHAKDGITEGPIAIQVHGMERWVPGGFWRWRVIAVKELP